MSQSRPWTGFGSLLLALAGFTGLGGQAGAQVRSLVEAPITLDSVKQFRVTSLGRVLPAQPYGPRACDQVVTHTNASFTGGTYTMMAGMVEGESLAQTYTVPASEWPIKLVSAEAIFATQNATVQTTTQWSVTIWAGTPLNGTIVDSFTSQGDELPPIVLGPGTQGTNLQFVVDPTDPDQVVVANNGSNQFTVAFTIDDHNAQSGNPCGLQPAPTSSNAFPVTDNAVTGCGTGYAALHVPSMNWLKGVNCGAGGCPSNGGWSTFSNLSTDSNPGFCLTGCRPRGDWVMRATWSSTNCVPGVGACCMPTGECTVITANDCAVAGGSYQGDGLDCGSVTCVQPQGACCFPNGFCDVVGQADCTGAGGIFAGAGTVCGANNTCPLGGCCLPNGTCVSGLSQSQCTGQGGTFRGPATNCDTACPPPNGACCASNGFCFQTTQDNCAGAGGTFYGAGVACGASNTCPTGACCLTDGSCITGVGAAQCSAQSGVFRGVGTSCTGANCPQPQGACCTESGFCFLSSQATCNGAGGTWNGGGTTCADSNGDGTPDACQACGTSDFNGDGAFGQDDDIEAFFLCLGGTCCPTCWHRGSDFNGDGASGQDDDIEAFFIVLGGGDC